METITGYRAAFGLETHVELGTATKAFCGCVTTFGAEPNTQVCPVCLGLPGALPKVNSAAVEDTILISLALNCEIDPVLSFARKHYFYPDIPKGFQTTQSDRPVGRNGYLDVPYGGALVRVEIERVHFEEDTGKSTHLGGEGRIHGSDASLLDYNRAGIPLVEIVTRPVVGHDDPAGLARAYISTLVDLLRALDVSEVRMDRGQLRSDVNVSLSTGETLGTRSETKNVNSTRGVEAAVRFEMKRQAALLDAGVPVVQETRHYHETTGETSAGRVKEDAADYRYFSDPDLVDWTYPQGYVEEIRERVPELPHLRRLRVAEASGLEVQTVKDLEEVELLEDVLATIVLGVPKDTAVGWWRNEIPTGSAVRPSDVAYLVTEISEGRLSSALARTALERGMRDGLTPETVVKRDGLELDTSKEALAAAVEEAITALPELAEKVKVNPKATGPLLGHVRRSHPSLPPAAVHAELLRRLG